MQKVAFQGNIILENPLHIVLIAVPLILQTFLIFAIAYTVCHIVDSQSLTKFSSIDAQKLWNDLICS